MEDVIITDIKDIPKHSEKNALWLLVTVDYFPITANVKFHFHYVGLLIYLLEGFLSLTVEI